MASTMSTFEHFILTRFNVPMKSELPPDQQPKPLGLDAGWLARRFDLFEHVCLPSVQRQTEGDFQWLVFLDWATPVSFKERMAALTVRYEFLRPVYCSQFDEEIALAEIRRREAPGSVRITTRLDNDDAIHPRLVEKIQKLANSHAASMDMQRGFFISFPVGCAERKGDFYIRREKNNLFVSFVSAPECARTVLGVDPRTIAEVAPVVFEQARPMWCQVFHDENVDAHLRGIYWPWGGSSEFAPGVTNGFCRGLLWQCAEVVRSAMLYLLNREIRTDS
jgi:hypothetical protein